MCGRIVLKAPARQVAVEFELPVEPVLSARYNITPGQAVATVRADRNGVRSCDLLHWGLVLPWSAGPQDGPLLFNARSETAAQRPSFRQAFARRRCLIPADGFYEWRQAGRQRLPHYFTGADGRLLALAGLWERWRGTGGQELESCTILTTAADAVVAPVHHRMPVILPPQSHAAWLMDGLNDGLSDVAPQQHDLQDLLRSASAPVLQSWPVSTLVNRNGNDGPALIERAEDQAPRQLDLFGD
jgi:putative SOS response-associated peptidase YedK